VYLDIYKASRETFRGASSAQAMH